MVRNTGRLYLCGVDSCLKGIPTDESRKLELHIFTEKQAFSEDNTTCYTKLKRNGLHQTGA